MGLQRRVVGRDGSPSRPLIHTNAARWATALYHRMNCVAVLRQTEGLLTVGGDAGEGPGWIEDDFDVGFANALQFKEFALDLRGDLSRKRTSLRGERHFHVNAGVRRALERLEMDVVDEAEVDNVAGQLGVVALLEFRHDLLIGDGHH
jgi:hypothetical protein